MECATGMGEVRIPDDRPRDAGLSVSLLASVESWGADRLREEWQCVLESSDDRLVLFQSPEWFDHIHATEPAVRPALACVRDGDGHLIGVAPLVRTRHNLEYSIKRVRLGKSSLSLLEIPGGVPPLPEETGVYDRLFELLPRVARGHDGLYLRMLPTSSFGWRYLNESPLVRASFALCLPEGLSSSHVVDLPQTFKEYLSHFKSKTRYNLQRSVKQLRERGGGELELQRFEAPDEVPAFLDSAASVASLSWQARCTDDRVDTTPFWRQKLTDLARRGLLRSYVLRAGSHHCAFALGYQGRDVFHYVQVGYDPAFAAYSPGSVLLYLLLEDLTLHRRPRRASFGYGDSYYKQLFGNVRSEEASVLLVNRRLTSRLKVDSYTAFRSMMRIAKTYLRRGSSRGVAPGISPEKNSS
jgi:hypothetical protein